MNNEKTLLNIISDLTTDKALQDKVMALYQDHKNETSKLKGYAWFSESIKTPKYTYDEFYDLFLKVYRDAIKSTRQMDHDDPKNMDFYIKKLGDLYVTHDYGESYECFFTYGKIGIETVSYDPESEKFTSEDILNLGLPFFGLGFKNDRDYLSNKNLVCSDEIRNLNGDIAYRTLAEWEDIFFNAPIVEASVVFENEVQGVYITSEIEKQITSGFASIKSLDQLSKEMPALLNLSYSLLENLARRSVIEKNFTRLLKSFLFKS